MRHFSIPPKLREALVLTALAVLTTVARAHDTWLLPERYVATPGSDLTLDLTSGMEFPELEHAIKPDRVESAGWRLGGKFERKIKASASAHSLRFTVRFDEAGIAAAWVTLKPRPIELSEKQVAQYLDEIGAGDGIRKTWADAGPGRRWREVYTKHAKTFIRVGNPASDRSWAEPVSQVLEIVPESDPTTLRAGDTLAVRVLKGGKPLAGFALGAVHQGEAVGKPRTTDREGRASFELAKPGRWLLRGTELRKSMRENVEWESDFATLTLEVARR